MHQSSEFFFQRVESQSVGYVYACLEIGFTQLEPVFMTVTSGVKEQPLTFKQAGQVGYDELRLNRRVEYPVVAWDNSDRHGAHDVYTPAAPPKDSSERLRLTPTVIVSGVMGSGVDCSSSYCTLFSCQSTGLGRWMASRSATVSRLSVVVVVEELLMDSVSGSWTSLHCIPCYYVTSGFRFVRRQRGLGQKSAWRELHDTPGR